MELFQKNGCLTEEGLDALIAGQLDELGRLEAAEHLAYCNCCLDRYTARLETQPLETAPPKVQRTVMSSIWVRIMHNTYGRMAVAGVAALLALSIWRSGTLDIILDRSSQLDVWIPPAQSQSLPDGPKHPDPMAQLYDKFTGALDGLWGRGKGPDAQTQPTSGHDQPQDQSKGENTQ